MKKTESLEAVLADPKRRRKAINTVFRLTDLMGIRADGNITSIRCPFHGDARASAKLQLNDADGIQRIWCYVCGKQFTAFDYIRDVLNQDPLSYLKTNRPDYARLLPMLAWKDTEPVEADPPVDLDAMAAEFLPGNVSGFLSGVFGSGTDYETLHYLNKLSELCTAASETSGVHKLKPRTGDEEYEAFRTCKMLAPAVVSTKIHHHKLPAHPPLYKFFNANKLFWIIPCATPDGVPYGFVLRAFKVGDPKHKFFCYSVSNTPKLCYGWSDFGDFPVGSNTPIILTEGIKDALFLKRFYPYTIAVTGTSGVNSFLARNLRHLTQRVVVAFDGDAAGTKGSRRAVDLLAREGISSTVVNAPSGDYGSMFLLDPEDQKRSWERIKIIGEI